MVSNCKNVSTPTSLSPDFGTVSYTWLQVGIVGLIMCAVSIIVGVVRSNQQGDAMVYHRDKQLTSLVALGPTYHDGACEGDHEVVTDNTRNYSM